MGGDVQRGAKRLRLLLAAWVLAGFAALAASAVPAPVTAPPPPSTGTNGTVGVEEHLGALVPLDLAFYDEQQVKRPLRDLVDRPTILILVFFHCPGACGMIQSGVAQAVKGVPLELGRDYRILTVSFDDEETPELAAETRSNYVGLVSRPVPADAWRYLTGEPDSIRRLCDAVGFRYEKLGHHSFMHPNLITVLARDGKVIRYLYGTDYPALDVGMALTEAARGTPGLSVRKMVSYCFNYDPQKRRYAFRLFRVVGVTILALLGLFLFFLLRRRPAERASGVPPTEAPRS